MVKLGSGTFREVENFHLSRIACLIIAENGDGKKPQVQAARIYFKEQTTVLELIENQNTSRILIYKTHQGESRVEVIFNGQTFWLTQKRMSDLYGVDVSTINYHLGEIYETGELKEKATIRKFPITAADGKDYDTMVYNLDLTRKSGTGRNSAYLARTKEINQLGITVVRTISELDCAGTVTAEGRFSPLQRLVPSSEQNQQQSLSC